MINLQFLILWLYQLLDLPGSCSFFCLVLLLQFIRIDSDDEGECEDMLFPGESDTTDAAIVLLRKKWNGKYTLFKVGELQFALHFFGLLSSVLKLLFISRDYRP